MPAFILTPFVSAPRRLPLRPTPARRPTIRRAPTHRSSLPRRASPRAAEDTLVLTEANVNQALDEVRENLGSVFGNSPENRNVGITGDVQLAELDGPVVVLTLKGRFWHKRADVLARVASFLMQRIPEICDVSIQHVSQLDDSEEETTAL